MKSEVRNLEMQAFEFKKLVKNSKKGPCTGPVRPEVYELIPGQTDGGDEALLRALGFWRQLEEGNVPAQEDLAGAGVARLQNDLFHVAPEGLLLLARVQHLQLQRCTTSPNRFLVRAFLFVHPQPAQVSVACVM